MVLTEEQQTIYYPAATLEGTYSPTGAQVNSMVNHEKRFYSIDNTKVTLETSITSWAPPEETVANTKLYYNHNNIPPALPNPNYPIGVVPVQTTGSANLYKLNATSNKTGLEFIIKVMAGDKIDILGKSYFSNTGTVNNANSTLLDLFTLMTSLLTAPANGIGAKGLSASQLTTLNTGMVPSSFFRGANGETTTIPKAYINYIFLDEQFKFAGGSASRVGTNDQVKDHWILDPVLQNITAPKNGYIFVYVSNESKLEVFFDNLQVIHKPGPILEETHYYPFGLTMAGISSKVAGGLENKKKYNGIEFENDLDLNTYDAYYRELDPQTGRWWQIDPKIENMEAWSPYASNYDNPITFSDPLGDEPYGDGGCCGGFIKEVFGGAAGVLVGTIDNALGSNIRGSVSSTISDPQIAKGWNRGLDVADVGSIIGGVAESGSGTSMVAGSATATIASGGLAIEVTAPAAAIGAGMTVHGVLVTKNGVANLVSQNGRVNINGNSKESTNPQHNYDIQNTHDNNKTVKTGTSGGKETKAGESYRGNSQANKWNKQEGSPGKYKSVTTNRVPGGQGARQKGLDYEKNRANQVRDQLDPEKHKRP